MNGLPSTDSGTDQSLEAASSDEQLESILKRTSRDSKVIFGALRGVFDLSRNDILNFYHLVDQRVAEQNGKSASICEIAVYYNNGTSRKFPTAREFENYTETRNRFPTLITIHSAYFISFPDSTEPEKQEIDIVIRSSESTEDTIDLAMNDSRVRMSGDKMQVAVGGNGDQFGMISYTINHSRTSWGLDLEGHISGHIEALMQEPTPGDKFLAKVSGPLNLVTTVFVGLYVVNIIIDGFFKFLYRTDGASSPQDILDIAANYLVNGQIAKYIVASLVVSVVFFVAFSGIISSLTRAMKKPKPSFIVLNDADSNRKAPKLKNHEKRWTRFGFTLGMNIIVALMVTVLEDRIWQAWSYLFP